MAKIIFNADDLGYSQGVNQGILYGYQNGVVNSSSLMVNMAHFDEAVEIIANHQLKNIGLHFNLTEGTPILATHRTIVDEKGDFLRDLHVQSKINPQEIVDEVEAQYQKAIKAGVKINHLDTHHHLHMTQSLRKIFGDFAKKYNLPLRKVAHTSRNPLNRIQLNADLRRVNCFTPYFSSLFYDENATEEILVSLLEKYKGKDIEIMCHPGFEDENNGEYNMERKRELEVLTSERIKKLVVASNNY